MIDKHELHPALSHIPWVQALKMGIVFRDASGGIFDKAKASLGGGLRQTIRHTPVVQEAKDITFGAMSDQSASKAVGKFVGGVVIPQPLQQFARGQDSAPGRKTESGLDEIKTRIPGLRETIPPMRPRSQD